MAHVSPSCSFLVGARVSEPAWAFGLCSSARQDSGRQGFRGTPPYAAPELYEGRTTSRTDQYALAVTYCELSKGQRVFVQEGNDSAAYRGLPVDLTKLRDHEFSVLGRALSERWTDRFPSCREFVAALKEAMRKSRHARHGAAAALPGGGRLIPTCIKNTGS